MIFELFSHDVLWLQFSVGDLDLKAVTVILLFVLVFAGKPAHSKELDLVLQSFETDGCTMFVEGTLEKPDLWAHCCFEHDLRYWFGGTKDDKKFSDIQLRECVRDVAGSFWANLMYNGVRLGSFSPIKFKYVWNWGWQPKRKSLPLNKFEIDYIVEQLFAMDLDPQFREEFLNKYISSYGSVEQQAIVASEAL